MFIHNIDMNFIDWVLQWIGTQREYRDIERNISFLGDFCIKFKFHRISNFWNYSCFFNLSPQRSVHSSWFPVEHVCISIRVLIQFVSIEFIHWIKRKVKKTEIIVQNKNSIFEKLNYVKFSPITWNFHLLALFKNGIFVFCNLYLLIFWLSILFLM